MSIRLALYVDTVKVALGTLRSNALRSSLTILGVVIGITSIVGVTSLLRGLDESLRDMLRQIGPDTIILSKYAGLGAASGADFKALLKRPNLTVYDAKALAGVPSLAAVDITLGGSRSEQMSYRGRRSKPISLVGVSEEYAAINPIELQGGRFFTATELGHRREVIVIGDGPARALFPNLDPIGKVVRLGSTQYRVIGVLGKRPGLGGLDAGQDDLAIIPYTTYQKRFGLRGLSYGRGELLPITISVVPRAGVARERAMRDVEETMRVRHNLKLDQANDFELVTQEAALKMWDQVSQATFLVLIAISSIALMVGGIGVMAIMTISVSERTREIGLRKAVGARRREVLWQFLVEAATLTSVGGVFGSVLGALIGIGVHFATGFPVSLPWWSFAIGFAFSASVGMFFGLYPAYKASRLDPIEALRYE
jgi:putative ABC transport system permease protein